MRVLKRIDPQIVTYIEAATCSFATVYDVKTVETADGGSKK